MTAALLRDEYQGRRRAAKRKRARQGPSKFRGDIEGLRAVAVGLVVLDHMAGWPKGGFIGVDVFFVISGYLITGLLLNETERRGRISFLGFYQRRARRILPASVAVLAAVAIAAHWAFNTARFKETVTDIWWALGFSANIHFAHIGTDYFQANRPPSPVQHFWSLAVEEQFYVVWPIVMLLVLSVLGRALTPRRARGLLLAVVVAGTAASFLWAVSQTKTNPAAAYFSTPVRAWELGVGAIAAIAAVQYPNLARRLGSFAGPLSAAGLLAVVASGFTVSSTSGFPAPWAALPVLATAVVILAGVGRSSLGVWTSPLTNPASRYVGRISYSLYLWHWPVIVIVESLVAKSASVYYPTMLSAMFGLTILSYHFVETPLRKAKWRMPSLHRLELPLKDEFKHAMVAGVALLTLTGALWVLQPPPKVPAFLTAGASTVSTDGGADPTVVQPTAGQTASIKAAVTALTWPKLSPSLDKLDVGSAQKQWDQCLGVTEATLPQCTFGDPTSKKVALVIGDSYAVAWLPMIRQALVPDGWRIYSIAAGQCPAAAVSVLNTHVPPTNLTGCDEHHAWATQEAAKLNPSLIILASADNVLVRMGDKKTGAAAGAEYEVGAEKTIRALQPSATRHILTISPPPNSPSLQTCDTARSTPSSCVGQIGENWTTFRTAEKTAAAATHTAYADTSLWFCDSNGVCPSFVGTTPVRWDGSHLTDVYSASLAPNFKALVDSTLSAAKPAPLSPSAQLSAQITSAADATSWPSLTPGVGELTGAAVRATWVPCLGVTDATLPQCTFGPSNSSKIAVLVGDSYAIAWLPMLRDALVSDGWTLYSLADAECPAAEMSVLDSSDPPAALPACDAFHTWSIAQVARINPSLVIMASADNTIYRLADKTTGAKAGAEYQTAAARMITDMHPSATRKVLTLSPPPLAKSLETCDTPKSTPADCVGDLTDNWRTFTAAEQAAAASTHTDYADTHLWFCTTAGICPSFVGNTPVRWDGSHLTDAYSHLLAPEAMALIAKTMG